MAVLIAGLLLFLGMHSTRVLAEGWRADRIDRHGVLAWRVAHSLLSLLGLGLLAWGYTLARLDPLPLWRPPAAMRHITALLMLPAFVLLASTWVPGSRLKAAVRHPMLLGVKTWALAHLLANGTLADLMLFGGFLAWAMAAFRAARRRDRALGDPPLPLHSGRDVITSLAGIFAWIVFALWLHGPLIGVRPFG